MPGAFIGVQDLIFTLAGRTIRRLIASERDSTAFSKFEKDSSRRMT
jgi:hypothetical protein